MTVNFIFQIIEICLNYLCYDPNYNYDDDDADDSMDTERIDEDEGYEFLEKKYSCINNLSL